MKHFSFWLSCLLVHALLAQSSGSITQGAGTITTNDLMQSCPSNHITPLGKITSTDNKQWVVPAETNFLTANKLSDLYNSCNNIIPNSMTNVDITSVPITTVDENGEIITGYIFADNYFELYINGVLIGVDAIPFTPFNSSIVRFKVSRPYTIAVKLVDWEENLGLGSEIQSPTKLFHPGDGGFIAQFSDGIVTDSSWKAQSFYIAPIEDLNSVQELANGTHSTTTATVTPSCNANCYGIHYEVPSQWISSDFNDSNWPNAKLYAASQVTNQPAYTNFANTAWDKANFIWSSNLILDNLVLARKTVSNSVGVKHDQRKNSLKINNPIGSAINFQYDGIPGIFQVQLLNTTGTEIQSWTSVSLLDNSLTSLQINQELKPGLYFLIIKNEAEYWRYKIVKE